MANHTYAEIQIIAEGVGPELEAYIEATSDVTYDLLSSIDSLKKEGDTWTFTGCATGRWGYQNNIVGYFQNPDSWCGEVPEEFVALYRAMKRTSGKISISWVDSDPAMDWISIESAEVSFYSDESLSLLVSLNSGVSASFTLANAMEAYEWSLHEVIVSFYGDDYLEAFTDHWNALDSDQQPTPEDAEAFFKKLWEEEDAAVAAAA